MKCSRCRGEDPNCGVCREKSLPTTPTIRSLSDERLEVIRETYAGTWPERSRLAQAELDRRRAKRRGKEAA